MSDPLLSECPQCKSASLRKQLTAAAFKLNGTGWYATDFKNSGAKPADNKPSEPASSDSTGSGNVAENASKSTETES